MGLIKGAVSLTRYRVLDSPPEISDDFISERLTSNRFLDIDAGPEEESVGWVEVLDPLSVGFAPTSFNFGQTVVLGLRVDIRRVSTKTVNRYLAVAEAETETVTGKPLTSNQRREMKAKIRNDLLIRTPLSTDVFEVCWFPKRDEVWLAATGTKIREKFEEQWRRTFSLGLLMKAPIMLAAELLPKDIPAETLERATASSLMTDGRG